MFIVSFIATVSILKTINLEEKRLTWLVLAKALAHSCLAPSPLGLCWGKSWWSIQWIELFISASKERPGVLESPLGAWLWWCDFLLLCSTSYVFPDFSVMPQRRTQAFHKWAFGRLLPKPSQGHLLMRFLTVKKKSLCLWYSCMHVNVCRWKYTHICRCIPVHASEGQRITLSVTSQAPPTLCFRDRISQWPRTHPLV